MVMVVLYKKDGAKYFIRIFKIVSRWAICKPAGVAEQILKIRLRW